jgi:hypothetical protein
VENGAHVSHICFQLINAFIALADDLQRQVTPGGHVRQPFLDILRSVHVHTGQPVEAQG